MSDCLSDYNVKIRSLALQSILIMIKGSRVSMNMSQNDRMKVVEEVRKDGGCVVVVAAVSTDAAAAAAGILGASEILMF